MSRRNSLGRWLNYRSPYGAIEPLHLFFGPLVGFWMASLAVPWAWLTLLLFVLGPVAGFTLAWHYFRSWEVEDMARHRRVRSHIRAWGRDMRARDAARLQAMWQRPHNQASGVG